LSSSRRLVVVLGEGAAVGLFVGGLLGWWEVWLNSDLSHRMFWLATQRLAGPTVRGAGWGILASATLALVMGELARRGGDPYGSQSSALGSCGSRGWPRLHSPSVRRHSSYTGSAATLSRERSSG